ncbi:MAG: hypothetical protein GWP07_07355 [Xanthomonadaceae bacterium]|nr:hypothetical protein [Xanthomonadaceae bacterium]
MRKFEQQLRQARDIYRELETASRLLEKAPLEEWSQERLQRFQNQRQQLFTALEKVNVGISAMNQQFPSAADMPAELKTLIQEQLDLIELIQQHDRKLQKRGQALKQDLAPLLKTINMQRKLSKKYQPEDKNPPPPRFFKATI